MPAKQRLPQTFPHRVILVASLTLCLCALGGIVLAVLSWYNHIWGYYFGTGFWSGGVILLTGIFGIAASYVRNVCTVKTLMIFSIFGFVVSLAMIALSCGGLDPDSGFYSGYQSNSILHYICHGGYLGLGVLQTAICILSDIICIHYLFVERHAEIYSVKLRGNKGKPLKRSRPQSKDKNRGSTSSSAPLVGSSGSIRSRSDSRSSKKEKKTTENHGLDGDDTDMPIFRNRSSFVKSQNGLDSSTPIRSPCVRPASFTTFGHTGLPAERASLIVHLDDTISVPDTCRSQTSDTESSHYAHTMLFEPPLPIEEDEELPPYEPYVNQQVATEELQVTPVGNQGTAEEFDSFELRRAISASLHSRRRRDYSRNVQGQLFDTPGKASIARNDPPDEFAKYIIDRPDLSSRLSQSEDTLNDGNERIETTCVQTEHPQGVQQKDFSRSSDRIIDSERTKSNYRSQSARSKCENRLERKNRAMSAEFKPMKDHYTDFNKLDSQRMGQPAYDSTSAIYAATTTLPSKFSLRTRLSQKGPREAIPVKSVSSLPLFSPPPKPPRTHSVTLNELRENDGKSWEEVKNNVSPKDLQRFNAQTCTVTTETNSLHSEKDFANVPDNGSSKCKNAHDYATVEEMQTLRSSVVETDPIELKEAEDLSKALNVLPSTTEVRSKLDDDVFLPANQEKNDLPVMFKKEPVQTIEVLPTAVSIDLRKYPVNNLNNALHNNDKRNQNDHKAATAGIALDSGPVLRISPAKQIPVAREEILHSDLESTPRERTLIPEETIAILPVSPVIKSPPVATLGHEKSKPEPVSKESVGGKKHPPEILPKPNKHVLPARAESKVNGKNEVTKPFSALPVSYTKSSLDSQAHPTMLSPSEKILQMSNTKGVKSWDTSFRGNEVGRNLFIPSAENNGARPKTTFFRRSSSGDPDERPIRPLVRDEPRSMTNIPHSRTSPLSNSRVYPVQGTSPLSKDYHSKFSFSYPDQASPKGTVSPHSNKEVYSSFQHRPMSGVHHTDNMPHTAQNAMRSSSNGAQNSASYAVVPSRPLSSGPSGSSQGVLHLVQAPYRHHAADSRNGEPSVVDGNQDHAHPQAPGPLPPQNQAQQRDEDKPFFSVVL